MPAKKKTSSAKKPAKKTAPKKAAAKKTTTQKAAAPKKPASVKHAKPAGPREQKLASSALKLVDQAAALLRQGIRSGANTSEKARLETKQRAHSLLTKASSSLSDALQEGSSTLHKIIGKL